MAQHQQSRRGRSNARPAPAAASAGVAAALLIACLLTGCAPPPPAPPLTPPTGAAWLDAVVPPGQRLVFESSAARLSLLRAGSAVQFNIAPRQLPAPWLQLTVDAPQRSPLEFAPRSSRMTWQPLLGRPYHILIDYPPPASLLTLGLASTRPANPPPLGRVIYQPPAGEPIVMAFSPELVAYSSPLHLILMLLGPMPPGQTRVPVVTRDGETYFAEFNVAEARREVRFPYALLWADWKIENLRKQSVFAVEGADRWPDATVHVENFSRLDPLTAQFAGPEPLSAGPR